MSTLPPLSPERRQLLEEGIPKLSAILSLDNDGGTISFVDVVDVDPETREVVIELGGACVGCSRTEDLTLKGVNRIITERFAEISGVRNVGARSAEQTDLSDGSYLTREPPRRGLFKRGK